MAKRMMIMLAVVIVVLAVIGGLKYFQVRGEMSQYASFQAPPEAVTTMVVEGETWESSLRAIGTVTPVQGVTVSADMPGIVETIRFESGETVSRGDVLVRLDTEQEEAQLAGALASLELAKLDLQRKQDLSESQVIPRAMYDQSIAEHSQARARVGEIRATIERKTIRAPFSGVLGIRQVNLGQYVSPGDPIVELQSIRPVYVEFTVPQQQTGLIHQDAEVTVAGEGLPTTLTGRIAAIDSVVDEATRSIRVQALVENRGAELRPGMFVEVALGDGSRSPVIPIPASAINYAPYGDSVYIVEQIEGPDGASYLGVRQQFVKLAGARGDLVGVVSGLEPGEEVVTSGAFKLRPGAAVKVNNETQPGADPAPQPQDS